MQSPFSVALTVRGYEIDQLGHVNHAVYHQYGEHARLELLRAAGCDIADLVAAGLGIVLLESNIRFLSELVLGDEVHISCVPHFGHGKTFRLDNTLSKADGTVSAEIRCTVGVIDLTARRLRADPRGQLGALAADPGVLDGHPPKLSASNRDEPSSVREISQTTD